MQIQTAPRNTPVYKPVTESWTLGTSDVGQSTQDLVKLGEQLDGQSATYHFSTAAGQADFTPSQKVGNAVGYGVQGAVAGATAGAMLGVGMTFVAGVGGLLNTVLGGHSGGPGVALLLVPMALGAVGGGAASAVAGYQLKRETPGGEVPGTLKAAGEQVKFYPHGQINQEVNLNEYQNAEQAPWSQPTAQQGGVVAQRIIGAVVGAAAPWVGCVPALGQAAAGFVGYRVGEMMDRETEFGKGAGILAGAGLGAAAFAVARTTGLTGLAVMSAGTAIAGAFLAPEAFKTSTTPVYQAGEQWWN